jgi:hypothetical protein
MRQNAYIFQLTAYITWNFKENEDGCGWLYISRIKHIKKIGAFLGENNIE